LAAKYVEGQITSLIMLDPDWAGVHGTQVYLADINPSVAPFTQRPTGVQRGAVMVHTHDLQTIQSEYKAKVCEHLTDMEAKLTISNVYTLVQVGFSPTEFSSKCTYQGSCALSQRLQAASPLINT